MIIIEFLTRMDGLEKFYFGCALVGGLVFMLRFGLMMLGVGDGDMGNVDISDVGESDSSFGVISVQGLTAFIMMFGLVGLAMKKSGTSDVWSVVAGLITGTGMMFFVAWLTATMRGLETSGNLDLNKAVGQVGTVYLGIPVKGTGKAQVEIDKRLKVMDAIAADEKAIKTGDRVKVIEITAGSILVVEKV